MALEVASLYAKLGLDKDQFVSDLNSSKESISGFGGAMGGMVDSAARGFSGLQTVAMVAGGALVAGAGALGAALYNSVGAAMQAQDGQAELAAVLESTGGKAGMTADAVNELASRFQTLTPFEDDVVLAGENMLLTFTNIGADVFPMATEAMLNMGQKFGSVDAAAVQLGKALNDPVAGVTALRKVGVVLTEQQEESIKGFMAVGDIASAQKIILGELETEFGGLAVAAGSTLTGKMEILKNSIGDVQEKIGTAFLPVLTQMADLLMAGINSDVFQTTLTNVANTVENLTSTIGEFSSNLQEGMTPMDAFIEAIDGLAPQGVTDALVNLRDDILPGLSAFFANNVQPIIDFVTQNVKLQDVLMAAGVVVASIVIPALASIVTAAAPVIAVGAALVGAIALARTAWENDWGGIQEKVAAAVAFIGPILQDFADKWQLVVGPAIDIVKASIDRITEALGLNEPRIATANSNMGEFDGILKAIKLSLDAVIIAVELLAVTFDFIADVVEYFRDGYDVLKGWNDQINQIRDGIAEIVGGGLSNLGAVLGLPGFDTGGVVPGATGSPQLVMAHGGETIIPTHKQNGGGQAGNTFNISINANDSAGGQRAADAFVSTLRARGMVTI